MTTDWDKEKMRWRNFGSGGGSDSGDSRLVENGDEGSACAADDVGEGEGGYVGAEILYEEDVSGEEFVGGFGGEEGEGDDCGEGGPALLVAEEEDGGADEEGGIDAGETA